MELVRHGVDIVDIDHFYATVLQESTESLKYYFTSSEIQAAQGEQLAEHMAGWFAAKEAVLKALGFGFSNGLAFIDIEIIHNELGAPHLILTGRSKEVAKELGIKRWLLSISHSQRVAFASVIGLS